MDQLPSTSKVFYLMSQEEHHGICCLNKLQASSEFQMTPGTQNDLFCTHCG